MRWFQLIAGLYLAALATAIAMWMAGPLYGENLPTIFMVCLAVQVGIGGAMMAASRYT